MKLAVISMIGDDVDILPAFLQHASDLFQMGFLLDHRSTDGSQEIMEDFCSGLSGWSYFKLEFSAFTNVRCQTYLWNVLLKPALMQSYSSMPMNLLTAQKKKLLSKTCCLNEAQEIGL